jgi:hypothetical protein
MIGPSPELGFLDLFRLELTIYAEKVPRKQIICAKKSF